MSTRTEWVDISTGFAAWEIVDADNVPAEWGEPSHARAVVLDTGDARTVIEGSDNDLRALSAAIRAGLPTARQPFPPDGACPRCDGPLRYVETVDQERGEFEPAGDGFTVDGTTGEVFDECERDAWAECRHCLGPEYVLPENLEWT